MAICTLCSQVYRINALRDPQAFIMTVQYSRLVCPTSVTGNIIHKQPMLSFELPFYTPCILTHLLCWGMFSHLFDEGLDWKGFKAPSPWLPLK